MLQQSSFQKLNAISNGISSSIFQSTSNLGNQRRVIQQRTSKLVSDLNERAQQAKENARSMRNKASRLYLKFNSVVRHIAGYPKIIYVPLVIASSAAYGYHSVKKTKSPHLTAELAQNESPLSNIDTFQRWVVTSAIENITDIVASKDVKKEGVSYLERMFKNSQVHDSLIFLLKNAVKDDRFVTESKKFGIDWITYTITSQQSKNDLKNLMSLTFTQDQRVVEISKELLKYFVTQPESKEMTKEIMCKVFLTDEVLNAVGKQLGDGSYEAVQSDEFQSKLSDTCKQIVFEEKRWAEIKQKLVYQPLADTLTFGLYSKMKGKEE
ncbi:UNKNOWN [Stylonychia lemnae]|uniref:Uncharacterized protein n=1 Tax=Stylonychia lemnae TaxID=5949 RepID=A0A078A5D4_STYLE|nr:UNKNOWN [Stylonychia lemnae]|eukprot:CDW77440.1 UNKNOWN [Stylonychia lemnae]